MIGLLIKLNEPVFFFEKYSLLKTAYKLTLEFRAVYKNISKSKAFVQFNEWIDEVVASNIEEFNTAVHSLEYHLDNILNFFDNRTQMLMPNHYSAKNFTNSKNELILYRYKAIWPRIAF